MKTSKTSMLILTAGLLFYAAIYVATSVDKMPVCQGGNYTFKIDSSIRRSFEQLPGYVEHRIYGKSCDSMNVLFLDSVNRNFSNMGDSICGIVKRNGYTLKGALVTKIDTSVLSPKIETLYSYKCL